MSNDRQGNAAGDANRLAMVETGAGIAARLLEASRDDAGFEALYAELGRVGEFQNFIVYRFAGDRPPELLHTNLGIPRVHEGMADYIKGLYALDPFYKLNVEGSAGLFRMSEIMPEAFPKSEYYRHFYKYTGVVDELRYVVWPETDCAVHVFVEREGEGNLFSDSEVRLFRALAPLVTAFIRTHLDWQREHHSASIKETGPRFDLRAKVEEMADGALTPREVDTVELMLKGHATKSIAHELEIDSGTVANHKRHIYEKLAIHSQAQLFDCFLRSLS